MPSHPERTQPLPVLGVADTHQKLGHGPSAPPRSLVLRRQPTSVAPRSASGYAVTPCRTVLTRTVRVTTDSRSPAAGSPSPTTIRAWRIEARLRGPNHPTEESVVGRSPDAARLRATGALCTTVRLDGRTATRDRPSGGTPRAPGPPAMRKTQGEQLPLRHAERLDTRAELALGVAEGQPSEGGDEAVVPTSSALAKAKPARPRRDNHWKGCLIHSARTVRATTPPPR